jgi:hypothetical protein
MIKGNRKNPLQNHTFDSILGEGMVIDGRLLVSDRTVIHGVGLLMENISADQVMIGGCAMGL